MRHPSLYCLLIMALSPLSAWSSVDAVPDSTLVNPQLQWSRGMSPLIKLRDTPATSTESLPEPKLSVQEGASGISSQAPVSVVHHQDRWAILLSDKTLYRTLRRWAQEAGYQLMWQIDRDYPIEVGVEFKKGFREALEQVMAGVALTDYPIQAIVNPSARVLRVVRHQDDGRR